MSADCPEQLRELLREVGFKPEDCPEPSESWKVELQLSERQRPQVWVVVNIAVVLSRTYLKTV